MGESAKSCPDIRMLYGMYKAQAFGRGIEGGYNFIRFSEFIYGMAHNNTIYPYTRGKGAPDRFQLWSILSIVQNTVRLSN
jgi:hypothetical protein